MGIDVSEKVEFELTTRLHECSLRDRQGSSIGPQFYVPIDVPQSVLGQLGEMAVEAYYEWGNVIRYKVSIERIDE